MAEECGQCECCEGWRDSTEKLHVRLESENAELRAAVQTAAAFLGKCAMERDELRAAIRGIDFHGCEFCPFCEANMLYVQHGGESHKPECIWTRCKGSGECK